MNQSGRNLAFVFFRCPVKTDSKDYRATHLIIQIKNQEFPLPLLLCMAKSEFFNTEALSPEDTKMQFNTSMAQRFRSIIFF
jgi:hypothetical protein